MAPPLRLGELLVNAKVITALHLNAALEEQRKWGGRLGSILVRMGALDEDTLVKALSHQLQIPIADFAAMRPPVGILAKVERSVWANHLMCPLSYDGGNQVLLVAVADPFDVVGVDEISSRLGVRVQTRLAGEVRVRDTLDALYGASIPSGDPVLEMLDNQMTTMPPSAPISASGAPVPSPQVQSRPPAAPAPAPPIAPDAASLLALAEEQAKTARVLMRLLVEKRVVHPQDANALLQQLGDPPQR